MEECILKGLTPVPIPGPEVVEVEEQSSTTDWESRCCQINQRLTYSTSSGFSDVAIRYMVCPLNAG